MAGVRAGPYAHSAPYWPGATAGSGGAPSATLASGLPAAGVLELAAACGGAWFIQLAPLPTYSRTLLSGGAA